MPRSTFNKGSNVQGSYGCESDIEYLTLDHNKPCVAKEHIHVGRIRSSFSSQVSLRYRSSQKEKQRSNLKSGSKHRKKYQIQT